MTTTLGELAVRYGCAVQGDPDLPVSRVGTLLNAGTDAISFLANSAYRKQLAATSAAAVILSPEDASQCPVSCLITDNPYALYARVAADLNPPVEATPGVHASAVVGADSEIAATVCISANACIGSRVRLAEGVFIGPGCVIGDHCELGAGTRLTANVTLCANTRIGARVLIHAGAVLGADGFGIAKDDDRWIKVPQLGGVRLGDDVEVGANTTIDRGTIEDTVIENGVKLDNQIQVGHNVRIGEHTVIAGCVAIAGSVMIGKRCMIGGAAGIVGHIELADDVVVTAFTFVSHSLRQAGVYSGSMPVEQAAVWRRNTSRLRHLDELAKKVRVLEKKLDENKAAGNEGEKDESE
ncbi:MAG: UDP-3-O-(3-hydroxymyristoyl)glucosamine N-acyltransferase [Gammaproteobacteria bacterium]|nr:UDP-3-O-(3-hydroxymyristoyl)glucosamine N-acyltransferase [Gammaproteobacteria bacterium]MCZ6715726.1 UDP-3-O-(3-hydroxymyristoyl)glucosamine N-acyltransferase [Gammaproteobacteria bacterium]MCZ6912574.1 UDP-3-O-(3-hydroxymyristoyl)glucosamine N-acyltransferase [Pseudomonadota bacterium]